MVMIYIYYLKSNLFCVGNITTKNKNGQVVYSVKSIVDINSIIIPHFLKYPLLQLRNEKANVIDSKTSRFFIIKKTTKKK
jgi:hypothetical protein